tara:strand:+ start:2462 stop:3064 length:603 start_codon:yes stop_codon:yes gene_type:complete
MKKKIILGTSLIVFFFSLLIFLYYKSSFEKKLIEKKEEITLTEKKKSEISDQKIESSNIMEDVSYSASDTKGNEYFLKASEGTIDQNDSNFIFLTSVKAVIKLKNYQLIEISSDFGKYNINNYDTIFSKNVIIKYLTNNITGDYLDFSLDKNLMIISRNVILETNKNLLQADVIEVNIETRDIKIFMYEENKKINIRSIN